MKISDSNKYLSSWNYLELAKYVPSLDRVIRLKDSDKPVLVTLSDIEKFRKDNSNTGLYTSIWSYNSTNLDKAVRLGSLYFDIDNADAKVAIKDCMILYEYLVSYIPPAAVLVYFTGKKGFHIECEPVALGINPSNNLPNIYRFIAETIKNKKKLESLDFSVYDLRRMWRLEGSKHQSTGLYKNLVPYSMLEQGIETIIDYCSERRDNTVQDQLFNAKANEWFRDHTYNLEIEKEKSKDFIAYFTKYGSSGFKGVDEKEKEFTKDRLLSSCLAVKKLYDQAKTNKFLEHEARLFLCSLLTYDDEAIKFLHEILSHCDDYNFEKSSSHINDWIKRRQLGIGGRPYTCERANSVGVGCGECVLEKRNKWIKVGDKYLETQEQSLPSPIRFAYKPLEKGGDYV